MKDRSIIVTERPIWERGQDSNLRPSGYEPDELPDCSTPRRRPNFTTACDWVKWPDAPRGDHRLAGDCAGRNDLDGLSWAATVGGRSQRAVRRRAPSRERR